MRVSSLTTVLRYFIALQGILHSGCAELQERLRELEDADRPSLLSPGELETRKKRQYTVVESTVSAYGDRHYASSLSPLPKFNFIESEAEDIKERSTNQRVVASCARAAATHGLQVGLGLDNCENCIEVLVRQRFDQKIIQGHTQTSCNGFSVYGTIINNCTQYRPLFESNNRWISLTFLDHETGNVIHQVDIHSTGPTPSVVNVAQEMCFSGFEEFPHSFDNRKFVATVNLDLELEIWRDRRGTSKRKPAEVGASR
jgi:hypothetical protein